MPRLDVKTVQLPDMTGHSPGQLLQAGEDYLAYSDEQWQVVWEECEEADRQRGHALVFARLARFFFYTNHRLSQRYNAAAWRAQQHYKASIHTAQEYKEVAEEAEAASQMVFEQAEQRNTDTPTW